MTTQKKSFIRFCLCCLAVLWLLPASSQSPFNLVPNYSFENFVSCSSTSPTNAWSWFGLNANQQPKHSSTCNTSTCCKIPNFLNGMEFQYPRTGNALMAMYFFNNSPLPQKRTYLSCKFNSPLILGKCYYVEFFVVRYITANYSVNNIGLLLTDTLVVQPDNGSYIAANPQIVNYTNPVITDTLNWIKVSGIYTAKGGEYYLTIGNFKSDDSTITIDTNVPGAFQRGAYFLDDVSVIPIDYNGLGLALQADAGDDKTIAAGDSVFIGTLLGGTITSTWYNSSGQPIANNVPGLYVRPAQSTWYVLEQNICGHISRDTVQVAIGALPLRLLSFTARRTGNENTLAWTTAQEVNTNHFNIQRSSNGREYTTIGKLESGFSSYTFTDNYPLAAVNYYRLKMMDKDGQFTYGPVKAVNRSDDDRQISLSPNPTFNGAFTITFQQRGSYTITITDLFGRTVWQQNNASGASVKIKLTQGTGMYMVTVTDQVTGKRRTQKMIVR